MNANVPVAENAPGMLKGNILSRVYEGGGDMSFYGQTVYYSPYRTYVGVKAPSTRAGEFLETDAPIAFDVATVNAYGKLVTGSVEYSIYKLNWSWWWNSTGRSGCLREQYRCQRGGIGGNDPGKRKREDQFSS